MNILKYPIIFVGSSFIDFMVTIGGIFLLFFQIMKNIFKSSYKDNVRELYNTGVKSLPIVFMTGVFVGVIMVIQTGFYVREYNIAQILGWGVGFTGFREVAPLMVGLMFSGRIGAQNSAELGTMKITDQIDALKILAIDPISFLIVPRFIGIIVMITVLTVIADFMTIISGLFVGKFLIGVSYSTYLNSFFDYIKIEDFTTGLTKSFIFGIMIAVVSSYYGLKSHRSSKIVGKMVNKSVVWTATGIFLLDFILTFIFEH